MSRYDLKKFSAKPPLFLGVNLLSREGNSQTVDSKPIAAVIIGSSLDRFLFEVDIIKENEEKKIKNCDEISKLIKVFPKDIAALDKRSVLAKVSSQGSGR